MSFQCHVTTVSCTAQQKTKSIRRLHGISVSGKCLTRHVHRAITSYTRRESKLKGLDVRRLHGKSVSQKCLTRHVHRAITSYRRESKFKSLDVIEARCAHVWSNSSILATSDRECRDLFLGRSRCAGARRLNAGPPTFGTVAGSAEQ